MNYQVNNHIKKQKLIQSTHKSLIPLKKSITSNINIAPSIAAQQPTPVPISIQSKYKKPLQQQQQQSQQQQRGRKLFEKSLKIIKFQAHQRAIYSNVMGVKKKKNV